VSVKVINKHLIKTHSVKLGILFDQFVILSNSDDRHSSGFDGRWEDVVDGFVITHCELYITTINELVDLVLRR
jgi:hypothetical protein